MFRILLKTKWVFYIIIKNNNTSVWHLTVTNMSFCDVLQQKVVTGDREVFDDERDRLRDAHFW